jgi:hypothetical protein
MYANTVDEKIRKIQWPHNIEAGHPDVERGTLKSTMISQVSEGMQELKDMTTHLRKQNEAYGWLYRWRQQHRIPNNKTTMKDESTVTRVLEIRCNEPRRKTGVDSDWLIWLEVKPSSIPNAGNGLFAMRRFLKCQTIAYYFGTKSSETSDEQRKKYKCGKIDAVGGLSCKKARLCLGVHFANDPTIEKMTPLTFYDGARLDIKLSMMNAILASDGHLVAIKQIGSGEEIYVNYNWKV